MPGRDCHRARDNPRLYPEYHPAPGETVMRTHGNKEFWLAAMRADGPAFRAAVAEADPAAQVPSCPEWTVAELTGHMVSMYRRGAGNPRRPVAPPPRHPPPDPVTAPAPAEVAGARAAAPRA